MSLPQMKMYYFSSLRLCYKTMFNGAACIIDWKDAIHVTDKDGDWYIHP